MCFADSTSRLGQRFTGVCFAGPASRLGESRVAISSCRADGSRPDSLQCLAMLVYLPLVPMNMIRSDCLSYYILLIYTSNIPNISNVSHVRNKSSFETKQNGKMTNLISRLYTAWIKIFVVQYMYSSLQLITYCAPANCTHEHKQVVCRAASALYTQYDACSSATGRNKFTLGQHLCTKPIYIHPASLWMSLHTAYHCTPSSSSMCNLL